jgi:transcriptional regulator with XRE-family HTH domain
MTITGAQVKAARLLLGWTQSQLAVDVRFSTTTISHFESGKIRPSAAVVSEIRFALESAGVTFVDEGDERPGVRLKKTK